jgi:hypothetical protein
MPSVCCLHEVISDWSGILTKNIAGSSGIELLILFSSIESIDTFVSIDDFDTFSIVSPITSYIYSRLVKQYKFKHSYCGKFLYEKVKQDRFLYGSEFVQAHFNVAQTKTFGHVNIFVRKCILLTFYGDKNKSL